MFYVRFEVESNKGFEVELDRFSFSPITGFICLWKGVFDTPKLIDCNQFIKFSIIDKSEVGCDYTFYRDYKAAFKIFDIVMEED